MINSNSNEIKIIAHGHPYVMGSSTIFLGDFISHQASFGTLLSIDKLTSLTGWLLSKKFI